MSLSDGVGIRASVAAGMTLDGEVEVVDGVVIIGLQPVYFEPRKDHDKRDLDQISMIVLHATGNAVDKSLW